MEAGGRPEVRTAFPPAPISRQSVNERPVTGSRPKPGPAPPGSALHRLAGSRARYVGSPPHRGSASGSERRGGYSAAVGETQLALPVCGPRAACRLLRSRGGIHLEHAAASIPDIAAKPPGPRGRRLPTTSRARPERSCAPPAPGRSGSHPARSGKGRHRASFASASFPPPA